MSTSWTGPRRPELPGLRGPGSQRFLLGDLAEQPVGFVVGSRGEEERVGRSRGPAHPELEGPQPVDHDRIAVLIVERAVDAARCGHPEGVDLAVAEVPDEEV